MTQVPSFLRKAVPAFHLEPEQTPAFKAWTSMTIYPRLMIIQFLLTTPEEMNSIVSKLQMILEQGHQKYQEMLAGHVPISMGILKGAEHPLLILQNVSSRTFKLAVIDSMKTVGLVPTKILTQLNGAKVVDLYQNNNQTPRFLEDVILGVLHVRQVFHQGQLDLVGAQAEIQVPPRPNKWYMVMTESKHLNLANILKTKAQLEQDAAPVPQKRSNPYQVIQKIKKTRENQSTTGPTTNAPQQRPTTQEEEDWGDPKRLWGASRNPKFILADHTGDEYPHAHILIACSPGGGTRGLRRCLAFLQSTPVQIAEATANLQRVVILEKCVAYMGKYGQIQSSSMVKDGKL